MNIVRVPFRVSLFGGGTDFSHFYTKKKATIVSFSIDRYCYISVRKLLPYFNTNYRLTWSKIEDVSKIEDLTHPSVKACLNYLEIKDPLEIHTVGDLPARSGLGSSSAFTAAFLAVLYMYKKKNFDNYKITEETIYVEQKILKESVGIQDQIQVCHGGFNITSIFPDSSYSILSLDKSSKLVRQISDNLIILYSGIARTSSDIHINDSPLVSNEIKESSLLTINRIAEEFSERLINHTATYEFFVNLLKETWAAKSSAFPKSDKTKFLMNIYDQAISSGASCGKLLGAGGGGFFAFFVNPLNQKEFIKKMSKYICVKTDISFKGIEEIL